MTDPDDDLQIVSLSDRPDMAERFRAEKRRIWPPFMFCDQHAHRLWHYLTEQFAEFQLYVIDSHGAPVAVGHGIPCSWDGTMRGLPTGWDGALIRAAADRDAGTEPDTLVGLEISMVPEYQRRGISARMIRTLKQAAQERGFRALLFPVRPMWKSRYPLIPMERYVRWRRDDGEPFDPWLRVHSREGAEILKVGYPSMDIEAPVEDWEEWSGLPMPESGDYVVKRALVPVHVDRETGVGHYIEPNVWVHHPITAERLGHS